MKNVRKSARDDIYDMYGFISFDKVEAYIKHLNWVKKYALDSFEKYGTEFISKERMDEIEENLKEAEGLLDAFNQVDSEEKPDNVNHPSHYTNGKYECIDVMEDVFGENAIKTYCLLNAFKYMYRCQYKHNTPTEDIKKTVWYLNKYLSYGDK